MAVDGGRSLGFAQCSVRSFWHFSVTAIVKAGETLAEQIARERHSRMRHDAPPQNTEQLPADR